MTPTNKKIISQGNQYTQIYDIPSKNLLKVNKSEREYFATC